jgi:ribose/xylose/arabinose/galactoside ABC-type transport system permease subunit
MDDQPGLSDQYRRASPWPMFVAFGIPIAELGILFGVFALSVGGLILFCGSVAGMLQESGYAETPWPPLVGLAVVCVLAGAVLGFTDLVSLGSVDLATRGQAILVAGVLLGLGGVGGAVFATDPDRV